MGVRRAMLVAGGALLLLAGCSSRQSKTVVSVPENPIRVDAVPTAAQIAKAPRVDLDVLYRVYSLRLIEGANADQRFHNRLLRIAGVVGGVNRNLPGRVYVELQTRQPEAFVYAAMAPEEESAIDTMKPGQAVEMLCVGDSMQAGSPMLRSCRLQ